MTSRGIPSTGTALAALRNPSPERRATALVAALGLAVATQVALAWTFGHTAVATRDAWWAATLLALLLALSTAGVTFAVWAGRNLAVDWRLVVAVAATGMLMRLPYFGAGPLLEDDHFRYLLDGATVAQGASPYAISPEQVLQGLGALPPDMVAAGHQAITAINFPTLRSIYPGGAQALFALAHLIAPWSLDGLRVVIFVSEALTAVLIWRLLLSSGHSPLATALYWCNPLLAFCLTGQAHIDAALAAPILLALVAAQRRAGLVAGLVVGFAVGVKLWPILLAPLIARALWPDRRALALFALALGVTMLLLCGPLVWSSLSANAGLTAYASGWSINNAPFAWASYLFFRVFGSGWGEVVLRVLVVSAAAIASLSVAVRRPAGLQGLIGRAALLAAILFYLSPAQFPWYAVWFLPLAAASGAWPLSAAAVGLPIYYLFFPLAAAGLRDLHGYGLAALHVAPVIIIALLARRSATSGASA
ncbi:MAG: glycosyltransferase 87 family protein [Phreatobacter sp.]|uniref:glycosyltransferase 87 family protein n=1 Tax=Phreatobacter sp. TaxID=1966341 RepID=UPI002734C9C2|nr:glycosyltransferase 87 family protein [Phreatobacter sp.]MDP2802122.1 glycosyltransferase 87 family protein [Phreatobacter sp.]